MKATRRDLLKSSQIPKKPSGHDSFLSQLSVHLLPLIICIHHVPFIESVLQGQVCIAHSIFEQVSMWLEAWEERLGVPAWRMCNHTSEAWHSFSLGQQPCGGFASHSLSKAKHGRDAETSQARTGHGGADEATHWQNTVPLRLQGTPHSRLPSALPISFIATTTTTPRPAFHNFPSFDLRL